MLVNEDMFTMAEWHFWHFSSQVLPVFNMYPNTTIMYHASTQVYIKY